MKEAHPQAGVPATVDKLIESVVHLEEAICRLCAKLNPEVAQAAAPAVAACKASLAEAIGARVAELDGVDAAAATDVAQEVLELGDADGPSARIAAHAAIEDAANRGDDREV